VAATVSTVRVCIAEVEASAPASGFELEATEVLSVLIAETTTGAGSSDCTGTKGWRCAEWLPGQPLRSCRLADCVKEVAAADEPHSVGLLEGIDCVTATTESLAEANVINRTSPICRSRPPPHHPHRRL